MLSADGEADSDTKPSTHPMHCNINETINCVGISISYNNHSVHRSHHQNNQYVLHIYMVDSIETIIILVVLRCTRNV